MPRPLSLVLALALPLALPLPSTSPMQGMYITPPTLGMHIAYLTSILALVSLLGGLAALKAKQLAQQGDHQLDQEAKTARRQRQAWEAEQEAHGEAELTPRALHDSSSDLD